MPSLTAALCGRARQALLLCLMLAPSAQAEPAGARMLDAVTVRAAPHHALIEVRFTHAVQVLSHFPPQQGQELRVRLNPVLVPEADRAAIHTREARRPADAAAAALAEVTWEGDMNGGPYLVLDFEREMEFEVLPGSDARSLYVVVMPVTPCEPEPLPPSRTEP